MFCASTVTVASHHILSEMISVLLTIHNCRKLSKGQKQNLFNFDLVFFSVEIR